MASEASGRTAAEQRLDEVIAAYLEAEEAGQAPDRRALLERHPDLAPQLARFFAQRDHFDQLAAPLRTAPTPPPTDTPPPAPDAPASAALGPDGALFDRLVDELLGDAAPPLGLPLGVLGDYEILEAIGRGGMGVVFKARQKSLQRPVALKVIRPSRLASADDLQRFRSEAELVALLDHPHIVPVYEVGEWRVGGGNPLVPYFSMKLIEGGSLAQAVAAGQWAVGTKAEQQRAARLMATVARAVHHAHQRGVLHRDLKPSNILLDRRAGGVNPLVPYVTDFGLATRLPGPSAPPGVVDPTQSGTIIGTPSYMAPEQTTGRKGAVSTAADVYGLGAILYFLLTGRPPFQAETSLDTLEQVRTREPVPPRRLNARVDRDLETICLKCLQKEPARRYGSAEALADDLERWLKVEPIQARPVGRRERVWRWCRRKPLVAGLSATAAGLLLLLLVGLSVSTWLILGEKERTAVAYRQAETNLRKARRAAEDLYTQASQRWLAYEPRTEKVRRAFLLKALEVFQEAAQEQGTDPAVREETARAFNFVGSTQQMLGEHAQAEAAFRQSLTIIRALAEAYPDQSTYRAHLAGTASNLAQNLRMLDKLPEAKTTARESIAQWQELVGRFPDKADYRNELAGAWFGLAEIQRREGQLPDAEDAFRRALAIQEKLLPHLDCRSALAKTYTNLGLLLEATGHGLDAETNHRRAIELDQQLVQEFPDEVAYQDDLGSAYHNWAVVLSSRADHAKAEPALRRAIDLHAKLAADFPSVPQYQHYLANHYDSLANLLTDTGQTEKAIPAFRQGIAIREKLAQAGSTTPNFRRDLAGNIGNLGAALAGARRLDEAEPYFRRVVEISEQLVAEFSGSPEYQNSLAVALGNLAQLLHDRGKPREAVALFHRAIEHAQAALRTTPDHEFYRWNLANCHRNLSAALLALGDHAAAARAAAEVPRINPQGWNAHYLAARVLARCVPLAEKDAHLPAPERRTVAESYAGQVMALLKEAMKDREFPGAKLLQEEPNFAPLRTRDDFKRLLIELEAK